MHDEWSRELQQKSVFELFHEQHRYNTDLADVSL